VPESPKRPKRSESSESPESPFYLSLDPSVGAAQARQILKRLATSDAFRAKVKKDPKVLYAALKIEVGEALLAEPVVLPTKGELQEALAIFDNYGEFRFKLEPFGFYTPGKNPFIGFMLLAAAANTTGTSG
jgi:hypothetical protein